jgi:hypothetical protein
LFLEVALVRCACCNHWQNCAIDAANNRTTSRLAQNARTPGELLTRNLKEVR